ncbi:hypothetical protein Syun_014870 [Stephania yunnanensis]|uniref:Uncharacterized protein n=1 Tax=Stephania yunnanensis TaxID=152371 RepID=A0AAP0JMB0_9MAGN
MLCLKLCLATIYIDSRVGSSSIDVKVIDKLVVFSWMIFESSRFWDDDDDGTQRSGKIRSKMGREEAPPLKPLPLPLSMPPARFFFAIDISSSRLGKEKIEDLF